MKELSSRNKIKYREALVSDAEHISELHLSTFKGFFLSSLGIRFLNLYYKSCIKSPEAIVICAFIEKNKMVGFSVGCIKSDGFHTRIVKNNFMKFLYISFIISLTKPLSLIRLVNNLNKTKKRDVCIGSYAELLSIGVSPDFKGKNIGKELLLNFESKLKERGAKKVTLTTDFDDNKYVLKFYRNNGYSVLYDFVTYPNRKMYKLIKKI